VPSRRSKPSPATRTAVDRGADLDPDVGLCSCCRHARVTTTARDSRFWRCLRAEDDRRFKRYPRLPIVKCPGYEEPHDA